MLNSLEDAEAFPQRGLVSKRVRGRDGLQFEAIIGVSLDNCL